MKKEKAQEEKRQATLVSMKAEMESVKGKVDQIKETVPEINRIRSHFNGIENSIAGKVAGRKEVLKSEGDEIISYISRQIDLYMGQLCDTIHDLKVEKRKTTETLYKEFLSCLKVLETEGLMQNDNFSFKDTVAYKKIVDKESFKKPEEDIRYEKNPNKRYIEFGYDIGNFFHSVFRAWETRNEPDKIKNTYINIEKYISDNIVPMKAAIDTYVEKLRSDYQSDIQSLKNDTKNRVDRVLSLIEEKDKAIFAMKKKAMEFASNADSYLKQIERIEDVRNCLNSFFPLIECAPILKKGLICKK